MDPSRLNITPDPMATFLSTVGNSSPVNKCNVGNAVEIPTTPKNARIILSVAFSSSGGKISYAHT